MFFNQSEWWRASNGYCLKHDGDRCHVVVKNDRCFATYRGDLAPALMVLDAEAEVIGPEGVRRLKVAELFCDSGANHLNLHAGEILVAVIVPAAEGWCAGYDKVRVRAAIDFPIAGVAAAICRRGSRLCALRVAITGCNSAPVQISTAEFDETDWDTATAEAVATAVRKSAEFRRTSNVSAKYRRHVLHAITVRLVERLWMQGSSLTVR